MRPDVLPDDPRALWREANEEPFRLAPGDRQALLARERRRLRWLTYAQYAGMLLGLVGFTTFAIVFPAPLMRAGSALVALVFLGILVELYLTRQRRVAAANASPGADPSVAFLRAELVRQLELATGRRFWLRLMIGAPSSVLFFLAFAHAYPALARIIHLELAACVALLAFSVVLARRRARTISRRIAELDALDGSA